MAQNSASAPAHRVTWFAPERPVENGTVYVRPEAPAGPETAVSLSGTGEE